MPRGREQYDANDRKSIKLYPDTLQRIRNHQQGSESYDDTLRRVVPDPEPDLWECVGCGAALLEPHGETAGGEPLCGRCTDQDQHQTAEH